MESPGMRKRGIRSPNENRLAACDAALSCGRMISLGVEKALGRLAITTRVAGLSGGCNPVITMEANGDARMSGALLKLLSHPVGAQSFIFAPGVSKRTLGESAEIGKPESSMTLPEVSAKTGTLPARDSAGPLTSPLPPA